MFPSPSLPYCLCFVADSQVVDELAVALERERHRSHDARIMLEGAVAAGGIALSEVICNKKCQSRIHSNGYCITAS